MFFDAVMHILVTLSFLNQRPLTTFARFIDEGRALPHTPPRLSGLLDIAVGEVARRISLADRVARR